jgi:prepilin-type N-terminal cleavage/methylation domain-containing protein
VNSSQQNNAGLLNPSPSQGEARVRVRGFHPRSAFTLVELMMSLIIIGMLTTLLGVAVSYAINAAKNTAIKADLANLDQALQSYKNNYGSEYPTCMAIPAVAGNATPPTPSRYDLFNRSLRKRFPRCTLDYFAVQTALTQGTGKWQTISIGSQQTVTLDPDNIDAAESLVFWLAGPPRPTSQPSVTTVLWGFCANPATPFAQAGSRVAFLYEFDETRLTDVDGDGWPEYTPRATTNKSTGVPPFVYFEPNSFVFKAPFSGYFFASYPSTFVTQGGAGVPYGSLHSAAVNGFSSAALQSNQTTTMVQEWGFALPYITGYQQPNSNLQFPSNVTFWNAKKFQLITGGLDCEYGGSQYEEQGAGRIYAPDVAQTSAQMAAPYQLMPQSITKGDNDNLTNFIDSKVEDYVPQ